MNPPDIAGTVRAELARQRKTQSDLQSQLGISRHSLYRRLNGESHFDARELVIVAAFLGLTVGELFAETTAKASA